jgi:hypothetical protein
VCIVAVFAAACGSIETSAMPALAEPTPGYPPTTSRLTLRLTDDLQKQCHATLVDGQWALTAAHCFWGVEPDARGSLNDFERSLSSRDVVFYPGAHRSLATRRDAVWDSTDFIAAHDLALVPVDPPVDDVTPVSRWAPSPSCALPLASGLLGLFGQRGALGRAQTAHAIISGEIEAAELLGPAQSGSLLAAEGRTVRPGDSGSGVTISSTDLDEQAPDCELAGSASDRVIVGVIQNADPEDSTVPFGLVPLHTLEHAEWLATIIATTPPPTPREAPRIDP